jgi:hypothetical protein
MSSVDDICSYIYFPFHIKNDFKKHAWPDFSIMNKFAMEKWEMTFPLEKTTHVKLPGNNCHNGNTFPPKKKHLVHAPEITSFSRTLDI